MQTTAVEVIEAPGEVELPAEALTEDDRRRITAALDARQSANTRRAYRSGWKAWEDFCARRGCRVVPAAATMVAAHISEMAEQGKAVSSIDVALAAIRDGHRALGLDSPTASFGVEEVRKGLRRQVGAAPRHQAHPLTTEEVRQIVTGIEGDSLRGLRDRTLILVSFAVALRRSEPVALRLPDLRWQRKGVVLTIRGSKADQERRGELVGVTPGAHPETDPVAALRAWVKAAELDGNDYVFCSIAWSDRRARGDRPLSGGDVDLILKRRAADVGLDHLPISGHSFRAGHATVAAANGVPAERLARTTRHVRLETLQGYIRPAQVLDDTTAKDLGL